MLPTATLWYRCGYVHQQKFANEVNITFGRIGPAVATIQFVKTDTVEKVPIPVGVTLFNTVEGLQINPEQDTFFITWFSSYELNFLGLTCFKILNPREQEVYAVRDAFEVEELRTHQQIVDDVDESQPEK